MLVITQPCDILNILCHFWLLGNQKKGDNVFYVKLSFSENIYHDLYQRFLFFKYYKNCIFLEKKNIIYADVTFVKLCKIYVCIADNPQQPSSLLVIVDYGWNMKKKLFMRNFR
jgi:hypothetical protein